MAAKKRVLTYTVYDEKVDSNDPDAKTLGIRQDGVYDWRDPDRVLILDGARVRTEDEAFNRHDRSAAVEPRWDEFDSFLQWNTAAGGHPAYETMSLGRNPHPIFKQALLEGRVLYGCIICRDPQQHG